MDKCLGTVAAARARGLTLPVVAMVSFSIIFKRGTREFAKLCRDNGLDGVVLPDVPLEEAAGVTAAFQEAGLRTCLLVAPTTPPDRRAAIARLCDGFIYYLSVSGITGERKSLPADIAPNVAELCTINKDTHLRRIWHFDSAEHVREVTRGGDGAIVGKCGDFASCMKWRMSQFAKQCAALGICYADWPWGCED